MSAAFAIHPGWSAELASATIASVDAAGTTGVAAVPAPVIHVVVPWSAPQIAPTTGRWLWRAGAPRAHRHKRLYFIRLLAESDLCISIQDSSTSPGTGRSAPPAPPRPRRLRRAWAPVETPSQKTSTSSSPITIAVEVEGPLGGLSSCWAVPLRAQPKRVRGRRRSPGRSGGPPRGPS
jgi:hypothetical protein